jgi:hypothetical protein
MTRFNIQRLLSLSHRVPEYTFRNVVETIAVIEGCKPVMRIVLNEQSVPLVKNEMKHAHLCLVESHWRLQPAYTTSLGDVYTEIASSNTGSRGQSVVAVAHSSLSAKAFLHAEKDDDLEAIGEMLGYPCCCIRAYENVSKDRDWLTELLENTSSQPTYPYQANRLAYLFDEYWLGFDYFPCSLLCVETKKICDMVTELVRKYGMDSLVDQITSDMRAPILIHAGVVVQLRGASCNNEWISYDLSRSRLFGWKVQKGADEDLFWESDEIERIGEDLCFYNKRKLIAKHRGNLLNSRLIVFN